MSTTLKYSRQRECIKEYLMSTKAHPTADMVYQHVREQYPKVSLGTVYRNLSLLAELGEVIKVSCGDGLDRFDGNAKPHYHLLCTMCNSVSDLDIEPMHEINEIASKNFSGKILGHNTLFHGTCPNCTNSMN